MSRDSRNVVGRSSQLHYQAVLVMSEFEKKLQAFLDHYESMRASEGGDDAEDLFNKEFVVSLFHQFPSTDGAPFVFELVPPA